MARHRWDAPAGSDTAPDVDLPRPRSSRPHRYLDPVLAEHSGELPVAPRHSRRRLDAPAVADLPAPDLPAPDLPAPDLPAPDVPAPDLPAPELPAPHDAGA